LHWPLIIKQDRKRGWWTDNRTVAKKAITALWLLSSGFLPFTANSCFSGQQMACSYETICSLPSLQKFITGTYPEPAESFFHDLCIMRYTSLFPEKNADNSHLSCNVLHAPVLTVGNGTDIPCLEFNLTPMTDDHISVINIGLILMAARSLQFPFPRLLNFLRKAMRNLRYGA
jgi:hypothetical protein